MGIFDDAIKFIKEIGETEPRTFVFIILIILLLGYLKTPRHPMFLFLGKAIKWPFVFCHRCFKYLKEKITGEAKRKAEKEKREKAEQVKRNKWQNLYSEMGFHSGLAENRSKGIPLLWPEDYENQQKLIIRTLKEFEFSVPDEKDLLAEDFDKCWSDFVNEGLREVFRLHHESPPTEERFLTVWEKYKPNKNKIISL